MAHARAAPGQQLGEVLCRAFLFKLLGRLVGGGDVQRSAATDPRSGSCGTHFGLRLGWWLRAMIQWVQWLQAGAGVCARACACG